MQQFHTLFQLSVLFHPSMISTSSGISRMSIIIHNLSDDSKKKMRTSARIL